MQTPWANDDMRRRYEQSRDSHREQTKELLLSASDEALMSWQFFPNGMSARQRRKFLGENLDAIVDMWQEMFPKNMIPLMEEDWYDTFKVYLPPEEFHRRHPGFDAAWTCIKEQRDIGRATQRQVSTVPIQPPHVL